MTVFVIFGSVVLLTWLALREWLAVAQAGVRLLSLSRRKAPAPRVNVQAVLDAVGRAPAAGPVVDVAAPIVVPPLESADPLWDRELDGGRG